MSDLRYKQANREAIWAIILTLFFMVSWYLTAYLLPVKTGVLGLPIWFELSCIFLPLIFIVLCWFIIKLQFKEIPLDSNNGEHHEL